MASGGYGASSGAKTASSTNPTRTTHGGQEQPASTERTQSREATSACLDLDLKFDGDAHRAALPAETLGSING